MRLILISPRLHQLAGQLSAVLPKLTLAVAGPGSGAPAAPASPLSLSVAPHDTAIVQFTSGSTALPKGVRLTHANVLAGLAAISDGIALGAGDGGGFWLPLFHDMGLFGVLAGIRAGVPLHIWSPVTFIKDPARWLREFLASGATISAMPDFGYRTLAAAVSAQEAAQLDMAHWRIAFNGAEPVQWQTVHDFTSRFGPAGFRAEAMFSVYGMAEATLAITFPPLRRAPVFDWVGRDELSASGRAVAAAPGSDRARAVAGVGRPVAGIELRLAVLDSRAAGSCDSVPDGTVGEILLRGASVTPGYLGEAPGTGNGWLRTGDLGYLRDGELFITGRRKEMITVRGANYYPQDVEVIARGVPGVFRGHCAAVAGQGADGREEVVLIAETTLTGAAAGELAAELRRRVSAGLGLAEVKIRLVKPRAIPRTSSGKVRRLASRDIPVRN
jgi:fatty-acyl-CoA synthase